MSHNLRVDRLARRFAAWRNQAARYHALLTDLALGTVIADELEGSEGSGSVTGFVTVRLDAQTWAAVQAAAVDEPPEPPDLVA